MEAREVPWRDELLLESFCTLRAARFRRAFAPAVGNNIRFYHGVMPIMKAHCDFRGRALEFKMLFDPEADPTERPNFAPDPQFAA